MCLQVGAKYKVCNGTIGLITDIDIEKKYTFSFIINGAPASRTQFSLINAFAFTVHKVQGLTLSLNLDFQIFKKDKLM